MTSDSETLSLNDVLADHLRPLGIPAWSGYRPLLLASWLMPSGHAGLPPRCVDLPLAGTSVLLLVHETKVPRVTYLSLHDDEDTAIQAVLATLPQLSGRLFELRHTGERNIRFALDGHSYAFDPNRIFTDSTRPYFFVCLFKQHRRAGYSRPLPGVSDSHSTIVRGDTMRTWLLYGCLVFALTVCMGCFGGSDAASDADSEATTMSDSDTDEATEEPTSISGALAQAQQAMEQAQQAMGGGESVEPVDFRELRDMLPESLPGMERTNAEGQKTSTMGIKVSQAEAEYRGDEGSVEISIIDMGTMKSVAMFGYAWLMAEMDKESDRGFERTTKYRGYPAYEKCEQSGDRMNCTFQVVVGERYIASVEGRGITRRQMEDIRDEIPVRRLDDMRNAGVSSE